MKDPKLEPPPSVDEDNQVTTRIEKLRARIASGQYKVDLDDLAVRVVDEMLGRDKPS